MAYAIPVSIASMLTFNYLFLPPVHTLALNDFVELGTLAVYLSTAVVVQRAGDARIAAAGAQGSRGRNASSERRREDGDPPGREPRPSLRPLTAIRPAASEGLASDEIALTEADRERLLETIASEVRRLERLVENLLDLFAARRRARPSPAPSCGPWSLRDREGASSRSAPTPIVCR